MAIKDSHCVAFDSHFARAGRMPHSLYAALDYLIIKSAYQSPLPKTRRDPYIQYILITLHRRPGEVLFPDNCLLHELTRKCLPHALIRRDGHLLVCGGLEGRRVDNRKIICIGGNEGDIATGLGSNEGC
jgi:hypothetical protein